MSNQNLTHNQMTQQEKKGYGNIYHMKDSLRKRQEKQKEEWARCEMIERLQRLEHSSKAIEEELGFIRDKLDAKMSFNTLKRYGWRFFRYVATIWIGLLIVDFISPFSRGHFWVFFVIGTLYGFQRMFNLEDYPD